ncbi:hypothetical protein G9X64_29725 [Rhizobium sophorae]|uniref:Uncharacterized protein n=1 Tax=Rhizobium sophorae TaxID=1535242 RepID=A0A7Y3WHV9_9HYPH|nr:DUF6634 family protein [Rhizobium sophorae]NNU40589.1 hypothetical protein [Rhizobium sophorae]
MLPVQTMGLSLMALRYAIPPSYVELLMVPPMTLNALEDMASAVQLPHLVERLRALAASLEDYASLGAADISRSATTSDWVVGERAVPILIGKMKSHPLIQDGKIGATTEVFFADPEVGLVRTFDRWYRLVPDMLQMVGKLQ